jgi:myo-inositol-1(or 4)-monophosphatase
MSWLVEKAPAETIRTEIPVTDTASLTQTLTRMAQAARDGAALLPPRSGPSTFNTFPELKATLDAAEQPVKALLRHRLEEARPGVEWARELDTDVAASGEQWIVDPIDGAVQYLQGLPQWSVSIALIRDGRPILAALHSATLSRTYTASLGAGAYLDGAPITPCAKTDLALALVGTSHPPFAAAQPEAVAATGRAMSVLLPAAGAHRNLGPTSWQVADVASGRLDAFWQYGRDPGNLLAAALVAAEAGVVVTDMDGSPWRADSAGFLAAPAQLHGRLLELFAKASTETAATA